MLSSPRLSGGVPVAVNVRDYIAGSCRLRRRAAGGEAEKRSRDTVLRSGEYAMGGGWRWAWAAVLLISFSPAAFPAPPAIPRAKLERLKARKGGSMAFVIQSLAFTEGSAIPKKYSCEGADLSPGLSWEGAPAGSAAFSLIVDDPDAPAGTWTHWIAWNIPAAANALPEGVAKVPQLGDGSRQGLNDFRRVGYNGPCPPGGKVHRYYFKLYALDGKLDLKAGASRQELERAMHGHVLAEARAMGTYRR
jgi:Raf kinase inhibitor-like YbhB/YbcL family protein